jgi:predicted dienelactone hydrolase
VTTTSVAPSTTSTTRVPSTTSTTVRSAPTTIPNGQFELTTTRRTYRNGDRPVETTVYVPQGAAGPWPLFVWIHGLGATPEYFAQLARGIAEQGVIVATPRMPRSNADVPSPDFDDYVNQPRDVSAMLDGVLADFPVDPARIGVGGHSLGAMTTVGLVADRCCLDQRVRAAVEVDGARRSFPNGSPIAHAVPTLWIHGDADLTFPVSESRDLFAAASSPKFLVELRGIEHTPWRVAAAVPVVQDTIERFLDEYLIGRPGGADALRSPGSGIAVHRSG